MDKSVAYPGPLERRYDSLGTQTNKNWHKNNAWKVSVFGVFSVYIFPRLDCLRTRKTPNTTFFHAVKKQLFNQMLNTIVSACS